MMKHQFSLSDFKTSFLQINIWFCFIFNFLFVCARDTNCFPGSVSEALNLSQYLFHKTRLICSTVSINKELMCIFYNVTSCEICRVCHFLILFTLLLHSDLDLFMICFWPKRQSLHLLYIHVFVKLVITYVLVYLNGDVLELDQGSHPQYRPTGKHGS